MVEQAEQKITCQPCGAVCARAESGRMDGMSHYAYALGMLLDGRVDYAQFVKIYEAPTAEERRFYSPPRIAEAHKTDVYGDPGFDLICTSHVERANGSLRQWCKRLTRLTYAFSEEMGKH